MESFRVVRPEHLNHSGNLFGGQMLSWVDEYGWLAATRDFPLCTFATRAMSDVEFGKPVPCGSILRFLVSRQRIGTTSVNYRVQVDCTVRGQSTAVTVFNTTITLVNVDGTGSKRPLPSHSLQA